MLLSKIQLYFNAIHLIKIGIHAFQLLLLHGQYKQYFVHDKSAKSEFYVFALLTVSDRFLLIFPNR